MTINYTEKIQNEHDLEELRRLAQVHVAENGLLRGRLNNVVNMLAEARGITLEELFRQEASLSGSAKPNRKYGKGSRRSKNNPRRDNQKSKDKPPLGATPEVEQKDLDLDEADKVCPCCGEELKHRESLDDQSEVVTIKHSMVIKYEVNRKGYACVGCDHIENALPLEEQFLEGGRYGVALIVQILLFKYWQSVPLNRQVKVFADHGLPMTTQTMWDNTWKATTMLKPVYEKLLAEAQAAEVAHADETRWNVVGGNGKAWIWTLLTASAVVYVIRKGRDQTVARELLKGFGGFLVTDGMSAYTTIINERWDANHRPDLPGVSDNDDKSPPPLIIRAGCWSHVRTYWVEAAEHFPNKANPVIGAIGRLYRIVEAAEQSGLSDELRAAHVDAALAHIKQTVSTMDVIGGNRLDAAKKYTLNQWERLIVFASHREVPLDNNFAERSLRTPVLGRKNFQGTKSHRGNMAAEILYSIIATCVRLDLSPKIYLDAALRAGKEGRKVPTPGEFKARSKPPP